MNDEFHGPVIEIHMDQAGNIGVKTNVAQLPVMMGMLEVAKQLLYNEKTKSSIIAPPPNGIPKL